MKYLFCVTSALSVNYGKYSYEERLHQLIDSFRSIKKYAPDSDVVLFDVSTSDIPETDFNLLKSIYTEVFHLTEHPLVRICIETDSKGGVDEKRMFIKTLGELANIDAFVSYATSNKEKYDRIFKLTGRYRINEMFQHIDYTQAKDKICMLHEVGWDRKIFPMRLWSFDISLIEQMKILIVDMVDKMGNGNGTYNIIEQLFHRCIHENNIPYHSVTRIGCEGNMFDGHPLKE